LLRDVLDLAHSQVGRLKLIRKPIDLRDVLQAISALVEPVIIQKGLIWRAEMPDQLVPVWGDAARIKQILLNLIHNAAKFTAEGEIVMTVEVSKCEVTVSISDTGLGIPIEEQELIFDEFHTTQRSAARGYGGMGLGLAICRKLVEMHHGRIGARSPGTEGSGSTFYFTLPTMSHYPDRTPVRDIPRKQTVLLLGEDGGPDPHLEAHLIREGFEIEMLKVEDTQIADALSLAFDEPPALVILDVETGSQRSQELMRQIKAYPGAQDVPILFYSLYQERNTGSLFMLDYMAKPVDTGTLSRALARYGLESHRRQMTILVVDDDANTLNMHVRVVQAQLPGCRVIEASDGKTALNLMRQWQPDLVLLDLMMPGLDGFDVLLAMQEDETTRRIPAIVLTAMSLTEEDMGRMSRGRRDPHPYRECIGAQPAVGQRGAACGAQGHGLYPYALYGFNLTRRYGGLCWGQRTTFGSLFPTGYGHHPGGLSQPLSGAAGARAAQSYRQKGDGSGAGGGLFQQHPFQPRLPARGRTQPRRVPARPVSQQAISTSAV
jgi:CheY-like chemotaxis protein